MLCGCQITCTFPVTFIFKQRGRGRIGFNKNEIKKMKELHLSVLSQFLSIVSNEQQIIEISYNFG